MDLRPRPHPLAMVVVVIALCACHEISGLTEFSLSDGGAGGSGGGGEGGSGVAGGGGVVVETAFGAAEAVFDSAADEDDPTFTADGLNLFVNIDETGDDDEIYFCERTTRQEPWGAPQLVDALSTGEDDANPRVSPDGQTMFLSRVIDGDFEIVVSLRTGPGLADWGSPDPVDQLNDPDAHDYPGAITSDGLFFVMMSERGDGTNTVFFAERPTVNSEWETPYVPAFIDETAGTGDPWISPDGLHLYWRHEGLFRHRSRASRAGAFADEETIEELDAPTAVDQDPWLDPERSYIMFARGTNGSRDIFEAFRTVDRR